MQLELLRAGRRVFAPTLAQAAIASQKSECTQEVTRRNARLTAQSDVKRQRRTNLDDLRRMRNELRTRFDSMVTYINAKFSDAQRRFRDMADDTQLSNTIADILRALDDIGTDQLRTLETAAARAAQSMDATLKNLEADLDNTRTDADLKGDDGEPITPEMRALKAERDALKVEGMKTQIAARDEHVKRVGDFITSMRSLLSSLALRAGAARHGDLALRLYAVQQMLVEGRLELARAVRAARDEIVPQSVLDDLDAAAQLVGVEVDAFAEQMRKDAEDLSGLNLAALAGDRRLSIQNSGGVMTWRKLLADPRFAFLEHVGGAKDFLESPNHQKGAVSELMAMGGQGIYMIRLGEKTPKFALGALEVHERAVALAAKRRARELCVRELKVIREDIVKNGWDAALKRAKEKFPSITVQTTDFFADNVDLPDIYSHSDNDVLDFSSSPSAAFPDLPFMERIKRLNPADGVTEIIPERRNADILDRPDDEQWSYLLARVVDRRVAPRRMSEDALSEGGNRVTLGEVWRNRRLVASERVRGLIEPRLLLEGVKVSRYPFERESEKAREEEDRKKKTGT